MIRNVVCLAVLNLLVQAATAQTVSVRLPIVEPQTVGMQAKVLDMIDHVVNDGIASGNMSGCVIAVGRQGKLPFLRAYGHRCVAPSKEKMQVDTVFDLASLTKPIATATSVMILWQQNKIKLNDKVAQHIPEFEANGKQDITIVQLLTHEAGLIPDNALADYKEGRDVAFQRINALPTIADPGAKFIYSDVGYLVLQELIERITGQDAHEFSNKHIFAPLGMHETGYLPSEEIKSRCATNDKRDGSWIKGSVHDPRAFAIGGVAGHAGLFSTAEDLSVYAQMLLNGGQHNGNRILHRETVRVMTQDYAVSSGKRGLGWDKRTGFSTNRGNGLSGAAYGHGGFTGTVIWMDPELDLFYVFLSNRLHPDGKGAVNRIAGRIGTLAAAAIDPTSKNDLEAAEIAKPVMTGLDVLVADDFELLKGQRIGLITNQTGIDRLGRGNIRLMHESRNVELKALFSPEHGLAGKLEIPRIADSVDDKTGLAVFSLYGKERSPSREQLANIDSLVFDIQDIGTRFYTYISTMGLAMQVAAKHDKRFYVLDRPNPIGGLDVSGAMRDVDQHSFVAFHNIPVRHGMTAGELARMFKAELDLKLELHVVEMQGWKRKQLFDQTGLWWVNPSPNIRNLTQAVLYPGIGLLETTNLSVGRGTDTPFEIVGAPWVDGQALAAELSFKNLAGVTFTPISFKPSSSKFANENCQGVRMCVTDRTQIEPNRLGLELAKTLYQLHPQEWNLEGYMRLLANRKTWRAIKDQKSVDEIVKAQQIDLLPFITRRSIHLIYD